MKSLPVGTVRPDDFLSTLLGIICSEINKKSSHTPIPVHHFGNSLVADKIKLVCIFKGYNAAIHRILSSILPTCQIYQAGENYMLCVDQRVVRLVQIDLFNQVITSIRKDFPSLDNRPSEEKLSITERHVTWENNTLRCLYTATGLNPDLFLSGSVEDPFHIRILAAGLYFIHPLGVNGYDEGITEWSIYIAGYDKFIETNLLKIIRRPQCQHALFSALHPRLGQKSFLLELSKRSTLFDRQVLRIPLALSLPSIEYSFTYTPSSEEEEAEWMQAISKEMGLKDFDSNKNLLQRRTAPPRVAPAKTVGGQTVSDGLQTNPTPAVQENKKNNEESKNSLANNELKGRPIIRSVCSIESKHPDLVPQPEIKDQAPPSALSPAIASPFSPQQFMNRATCEYKPEYIGSLIGGCVGLFAAKTYLTAQNAAAGVVLTTVCGVSPLLFLIISTTVSMALLYFIFKYCVSNSNINQENQTGNILRVSPNIN